MMLSIVRVHVLLHACEQNFMITDTTVCIAYAKRDSAEFGLLYRKTLRHKRAYSSVNSASTRASTCGSDNATYHIRSVHSRNLGDL